MTFSTIPDRTSAHTVTSAGQPLPPHTPSPYSGPLPGPGGPQQRPLDPVKLAAEFEMRLTHQGHSPGSGYRRADLAHVMRMALAVLDIPATDDPLAGSRIVARRVAALAGGVR